MVFQGLARYDEPLLNDELGFAQSEGSEGIALQLRRCMDPEITDLIQQGLPDIPVEAMQGREPGRQILSY